MIGEALSLRVGDVWREGEVAHEVTIARRHLKGGHGPHRRAVNGRRVVLSEIVRAALAGHLAVIGTGNPDLALFTSAKARGQRQRSHRHPADRRAHKPATTARLLETDSAKLNDLVRHLAA
jgi:hypothetical protein